MVVGLCKRAQRAHACNGGLRPARRNLAGEAHTSRCPEARHVGISPSGTQGSRARRRLSHPPAAQCARLCRCSAAAAPRATSSAIAAWRPASVAAPPRPRLVGLLPPDEGGGVADSGGEALAGGEAGLCTPSRWYAAVASRAAAFSGRTGMPRYSACSVVQGVSRAVGLGFRLLGSTAASLFSSVWLAPNLPPSPPAATPHLLQNQRVGRSRQAA